MRRKRGQKAQSISVSFSSYDYSDSGDDLRALVDEVPSLIQTRPRSTSAIESGDSQPILVRVRVTPKERMEFAFISFLSFKHLNNTLVEHGIGDFHESGYVCADHEIAGLTVLFRSIPGVLKNRGHNVA